MKSVDTFLEIKKWLNHYVEYVTLPITIVIIPYISLFS